MNSFDDRGHEGLLGKDALGWIVALALLVSACASGGAGTGDTSTTTPSTLKDGYTDKFSYIQGEEVTLYLNFTEHGTGIVHLYDVTGRQVDSTSVVTSSQTAQGEAPWKDGFGYQPSGTYTVASFLESGVYSWENKVPFIVKKPAINSDIVVLCPSNTEAAYNNMGGRSFYTVNQASTVSFRRPSAEPIPKFWIPFIAWLTSSTDYNVGYICDLDMENYEEIRNASLVIIIGHSEYWTRQARNNLDLFVDSGKPVLILSGNTMWWQVRYSEDRTKLICYKDRALDPIEDPLLKTINWNDPSLHYSILGSIGGDFPHGGYGTRYHTSERGWDGFKVADPESPAFRGLDLPRGHVISMPSLEYDGTLLSGFDSDGYPIVDAQALGFYRAEIIGYDLGARGTDLTVGTWIAIQRTPTSGVLINGASTNWCSFSGIGGTDHETVKKVIRNMIDALLAGSYVF